MLRVDYERWNQSPEELRRLAMGAEHARTRERFLALYEITQTSCATRVAESGERNAQTVMKITDLAKKYDADLKANSRPTWRADAGK